jgi:hypothetical protein
MAQRINLISARPPSHQSSIVMITGYPKQRGREAMPGRGYFGKVPFGGSMLPGDIVLDECPRATSAGG